MRIARAESTSCEIRLVGSCGAAVYGTWGDLLVLVGHGRGDRTSADEFGRILQQLLKSRSGPLGILGIIRQTAVPDADARRAVVQAFRDYPGRLRASFVLQGSGFSVAAQRALITSTLLAIGKSKAIAAATSIPEALHFLAPQLASLKSVPIEPLTEALMRFSDEHPAAVA